MRIMSYSCFILASAAALQAAALADPTWQKMPGKMRFVTAAADGTVIGSSSGFVQTWDGTGWKATKPDSRTLLGSADTYAEFHPFAGNANSIWLLKLATPNAQSGSLYQLANGAWQLVPGGAQALSMGGDGSTVFALGNGFVYEYCLCGQAGQTPAYKWITRSGTPGFGQLYGAFSMAGPQAWAVGNSADKPLYLSSAAGSTDAWASAKITNVTDISSAPDGTVVALSGGSLLMRTASGWAPMKGTPPSGIVQVSAGRADFIWVVTNTGDVYAFKK